MSVPARQVRARQAAKPRARTSPSRRPTPKGTAPKRTPQARKRTRRTRRPIAFFVMATAVVAGMVFGLAATNVLLAQGSFRLDALTREQDQLTQQNGELRLQVADLSTPGRIAQEARRLGLVLPSRIEIVQPNGSRQLTAESGSRSATKVRTPALSPAPTIAPAPPKPGGTG